MEVKIGIGIEDIIFGMSQEDVISIWGKPDKISEEEITNAIVYYYNNKMIKVKFDKEEAYKLYSIEVHNPEVLMFGNHIYLVPKSDIETSLRINGYSNFEYDDYETFDTIFCDEISSTFEFIFNKLISVEFSPIWKNDNEIIWPNR